MKWANLPSALLILALFVAGCAAPNGSEPVVWSLSRDGGDLAFNWCGGEAEPCTLALYNFEKERLLLYRNPTGRDWGAPSFSFYGGQLAFPVRSPDGENAQIAVMNLDGTDFHEVTRGKAYRYAPTFSRDGRNLTYLCATSWSERYWTPYKGNVKRLRDSQVCVLNIPSGWESTITTLNAYAYTRPFFLPDNLNVLVHYQSFERHPQTGVAQSFNIVQPTRRRDPVVVLMEMPRATHPEMSADGWRIVFNSAINEMDGTGGCCKYDLFLWEGPGDVRTSKGTIRRLTTLRSYFAGFAISADGRKLAYAIDEKRNGKLAYFLMDIDTGDVRPFVIPEKPDGWIPSSPTSPA